MQELKDYLSVNVRPSFKDARMSLETALASTALGPRVALTCAYAVAVSLKASELAARLAKQLSADQIECAEVAAAVMGMTNVYYSFVDVANLPGMKALPAQIRMVTYGQQSAKDKPLFEAAALAVSIAGKCKPCIAAHVDELKKLQTTDEQFRDLGRIAAAVHAVSKVLS